jgi:hypothetical protein
MTVRPSVIAPWGTWADDDDLNQKGGMIVWERSDDNGDLPDDLRSRFPKAEVLPEILELPYKTSAKIPPLRIGIAIVPPPSGKTTDGRYTAPRHELHVLLCAVSP